MSEKYLSRDREHLARLQRKRRKGMTRIDYMPGNTARAVFLAARSAMQIGTGDATNSAVLDAILAEWAALTGINYQQVDLPKSPERKPALVDRYARAYESGRVAVGRVGGIVATKRVTCGARRHRDGKTCQAKSEPGRRRCRFHGGCSTGPRSAAGIQRSLRNLVQFRRVDPKAYLEDHPVHVPIA